MVLLLSQGDTSLEKFSKVEINVAMANSSNFGHIVEEIEEVFKTPPYDSSDGEVMSASPDQ